MHKDSKVTDGLSQQLFEENQNKSDTSLST